MEGAVKQFARRIVVVHLTLFVGVLIVVLFASRHMYQSARDEAVVHAESRQRLLASQTVDGVEHFYGSVLNDLQLLRRADVEGPREITVPLGRVPVRVPLPRGLWFAPLIAQQLEGRASQVFLIDRRTMAPRVIATHDPQLPADRIVAEWADWLRSVDGPAISPFANIEGRALHLMAVPVGGRQRTLLVAVVPMRQVETLYLNKLNQQDTGGAFLADESMTVMATSRRKLVGANAARMADDSVRQALDEWRREGFRGTKTFDRPMTIALTEWEPSLVTAEPVRPAGPDGPTWHLFVALQLSEVNAAVTRLWQQTVLWTIFIVVALTGILASTAVQLIRGRVRLEQVRRELLERDLDEARQIQLAWLPTARLSRANVDVAAMNEPARHISGDFYNWFELPDGRIGVAIGDVTGHGMSAAFLMATTQLLVRNTLPRLPEPGQCLEEVNRQLCAQSFNGQFVTMQVLVLDPDTGHLQIANAGHMPPLVCGGLEDWAFKQMPVEPQLALGIVPTAVFPTEQFTLPPRSSLLLYTDGVIEVESPDGNRLNLEGLLERLKGFGPSEAAQELVDHVISVVNEFRQGQEIADDLTVVGVQLQTQAAEAEPELVTDSA